MTTTTKIALGIVGAAAAGIAISLIVAPEKSKALRAKISDAAGSWADTIMDKFSKKTQDVPATQGSF
jgi:gas vesicle protein